MLFTLGSCIPAQEILSDRNAGLQVKFYFLFPWLSLINTCQFPRPSLYNPDIVTSQGGRVCRVVEKVGALQSCWVGEGSGGVEWVRRVVKGEGVAESLNRNRVCRVVDDFPWLQTVNKQTARSARTFIPFFQWGSRNNADDSTTGPRTLWSPREWGPSKTNAWFELS